MITFISAFMGWSERAKAAEPDEFMRFANLGKAYLENREWAKATEALTSALQIDPKSVAALRNRARAQIQAGNTAPALITLNKALELQPESAATSYLLGLTDLRGSKFAEASVQFEKAARLDPHTATIRFQLAGAHTAIGRSANAREQLLETVRLDPLHASAHYKLATLARESGDMGEFQSRMREFTRLRKMFGDDTRTPEALESCVHTWAEALPAPPAKLEEAPTQVRFQEATEVFADSADATALWATIIELSDEGRYTLLTVGVDGTVSLLRMNEKGRFQRTALSLKLPGKASISCGIAGDFHNDATAEQSPEMIKRLTDVFLIGPDGSWLLKRTGPEEFTDVTQAAGLARVTGRRACWVDYEHDGDIDLLIARDSGAELWQNNGNGTYGNVSAQTGIEGTGSTHDVAVADLDANVAVDVLIARGSSPTLVFENQRAGRFARMPEPPGPWPTAKRLLIDHLDSNGRPDAVLIGDRSVELIPQTGRARSSIAAQGLEIASSALLDFDNDGKLDIVLVGRKAADSNLGAIRLLRNGGEAEFKDATEVAGLGGLKVPAIREVLAADIDADADTDLVLLTADDRLRFLRNTGGSTQAQIKVRFVGTKSNPLGLGTHVEVRRGAFLSARTVQDVAVEVGLGPHRKLDILQTVWANGVVDNQIDVTVSERPITIHEKNVATGSCPFLYVWDGTRFRFVTDLLGNSPVGLSLRRDVMLPADPDEIVMVGPADQVEARDGKYVFQVTSEFREVLYLDSVTLLAVDHPSDVEVHSTDKLAPPPFPPSEVWSLHKPAPLLRATDGNGIDRITALRTIDGVYVPPGRPLPPPYRGMCQPLTLTMDFGPLNHDRPLVVALTGWLQYGDASTNIALSQDSSLTVIPPRLEAETSDGRWIPVDVMVGMPAGKTKTILCDVSSKLPNGTSRLRLTTTFEIRWDRLALFQRLEPSHPVVHELKPRAADLQWRGFSEIKARGDGHPTTPDHARVSDRPPWRTALQGWCTRYGDVLGLVNSRDEKLAIINGGDALTLEFSESDLPPLASGLKRTFMFYSVGWDKDGDYNVVAGDTVGPLPIPPVESFTDTEPGADDWQVHYNTRWVPQDAFASPKP